MKKQLEKPFEYLKRKDGSGFSTDIIKNWYEARAYVLDKLKNTAFPPGSKSHLHVVVTTDTPLMLSAIRQVALTAHYPNFEETTGKNRSLITLVSQNPQIIEELSKEEYLGNLPTVCKYTLYHAAPVNPDSYIDIELQIVDQWPDGESQEFIKMSEDEVKAFLQTRNEEDIYCIDTHKAVLANRIYSLGTLIDNLPAEDINNTKRYMLALDVFQKKYLRKQITPLIDTAKWKSDPILVKNGLSNIFCTDCFMLRAAFCKEENNEALSISEHARWVVDKLIMGFRPMNHQERITDERLFGEMKKRQYRNQLKKNPSDPVHIDICSYSDLRRIDPDSLKYDSFLMLAIPTILSKTGISTPI